MALASDVVLLIDERTIEALYLGRLHMRPKF